MAARGKGGGGPPACLNTHDAVGTERPRPSQEFGVLLGVDVIGNGGNVIALGEQFAQPLGECGFSGADRAADSYAQGSCHDLNNLVYCVSCRKELNSNIGAAVPRSCKSVCKARSRTFVMSAASRAIAICASC